MPVRMMGLSSMGSQRGFLANRDSGIQLLAPLRHTAAVARSVEC